jgi:hypothetical protein
MAMAAESFNTPVSPVDAIVTAVMGSLAEVLNASLSDARRQGAWEEALMVRQFEQDRDLWDQATPLEMTEARIRAKFDTAI